ncbi:hypothetical protein C923_03178 [Plasmodium falciparum UGT5.1]|uniref:Erythrocyte membrane protein 1 n=1 Tax=Plasmodium falciparum UGT5.1 TaxID=1237627 RepID=W7JBB0_PLAFA|nr:hypothetical protein C923_03178 [Plasmodium falciparum UGT5.1]
MAAQGGGEDGIEDESAKHLLDSIGKKVHDQVKNAANDFSDDLKGKLLEAKDMGETAGFSDTCKLVEQYRSKAKGDGERYPCTELGGKKGENRFSDTLGGQCTDSKMRSDGIGACAPFRRLHLCDYNLETIETTSTAKHDLLAEVCMAAYYEGDLIKTRYTRHQQTNPDSQLCTVLARSFADIGDIIRGRDLFYGNTQESTQRKVLDEKLKTIFGKIHSDVTRGKKGAKDRYEDNDTDKNYYQLREDWWTANRHTVWEAITCKAEQNNKYFRDACSGGTSPIQGDCRCPKTSGGKAGKGSGDVNIVPTYFDYVPQYLRWFEEWAEDFCRLRKHRLKDAIDKCRGPSGNDKYCSGNGFDCEETIRGDRVFVEGKDCIDCHHSCTPFVKWLDNQKLEFLKQKKKYTSEIKKYKNGASGSTGGRAKRSVSTTNYDGYESKFYKELKEKKKYGKVNGFLELLNKETTCKKINDEEEGGKIDFKTVNSGSAKKGGDGNKTFYRTKYCEACPWCGVNGPKENWTPKGKETCGSAETKTYDRKNITEIPVLTPEEGQSRILKKYKNFCDAKGEKDAPGKNGEKGEKGEKGDQIKKWECHYDDKGTPNVQTDDSDNCIQGEWQNFTGKETVKSYNAFFWKWVHDMLHDSVEWKRELSKCINNNTNGNRCRNGCNRDCKCYESWVEQKETEWGNIVEHFGKQKNISAVGPLAEMMKHDIILEGVLKGGNLLQNIKDVHGDTDDIEHIEALLDEEKKKNQVEAAGTDNKNKTTIDKLLKHEKEQAEQCKKIQKECEEQESADRSLNPLPPANPSPPPEEKEDEDDDDNYASEDEVEEEGGDAEGEDGKEETVNQEGSEPAAPPPPTQNDVNVCSIVADIFKETESLDAACTQKYAKNNSRLGWKCIPTSGENTTTGSKSESPPRRARSAEGATGRSGDNTGSSDATTGGLCIPPRRRKLYVTPLTKWAEKYTGNTQSVGGTTQVEGQVAAQSSSSSESSQASEASQTSSSSSTPSPSDPRDDDLRNAFVESAAIETFFLWHKYKVDKQKEIAEKKKQQQADGLFATPDGGSVDGDDEDPQNQLKKGIIPDGFLRQMFYTLGDYRDILYSGSKDAKNGYNDILRGDKEIAQRESKIQQKLKTFFSNSGDKPSTGTSPGSSSVKNPKTWWETNGQHIWHGMICALTYDTDSGAKDKAPTQNGDLKDKLWDDTEKKPKKNDNVPDYTYENVELKEDKNSGAKTNEDTSSHSGTGAKTSGDNNPPKLIDFVLRPPYFRYLEEWGQNFCKERKKRLEKIKGECRSDKPGRQYCSGDGHDCIEKNLRHHKMLEDPNCPSCYEQCRKYRKWIDIKFEEFHNQKNKYGEEHGKVIACSKNGGGDNNCCTEIEKKNTAPHFLAALKHCKDDEAGEVKKSNDPNNKIDFNDPKTTFGPLEYCKTCPFNGVTCNSGGRGGRIGGTNGCTEKDPKWKSVFNGMSENSGKTTTIDVQMIDRRGPFIKEYLNNLEQSKNSEKSFKDSYLFKSVRTQEWKCKFENVKKDVCYLKNFNDKIDLNQYTTFKVFLVYWLEDFLYGYYILKKKRIIDLCTKNGGNTCDKEPKIDCACVKAWVDQKKKEWKQIQEHFNNRNPTKGDDDMKSSVKQLLDPLIPRMDLVNGKEKINELNEFLKSYECKCADSSQKNVGYEDAIECMLKKLEEKTKKCAEAHKENSGEKCSPAPQQTLDLDDQIDEDPENKVEKPAICGDVDTTEEEETDEKCEEASSPDSTVPEKKEQEPTEKKNTEDQTPPTPSPAVPPSTPTKPLPSDNTSDILKTTIPFGIALALTSIVFLFLKKKTKSTIDLLRVINIPKGDYDIPTKLSPNRYIPYTSGKYRGKRYIYLEGDSGTDSGYTDHYSDITSSSESEYEEMDINDIYVPGSPKYKTLIEVVLEPSGNNTTASGNNTTASDTQNDIPNDGIPSSKFTDNEWNTLKDEFISQYLQSEQPNDIPNDYSSGDIPFNTEPNILYFNKPEEKPFIMSIHDRDLYTGEEYSYNVNMVNSMDDIPINRDNNPYSGIDLINDTLSGNQHIDIYDEVLKRKENELFGTNHTKKNTSTNSVAKLTNSDPILNQINLFHKWLDRHRDMCEQWNNKEELLDKLKEEWENETHSGNKHSDIPSGKLSDTPSDNNIHSDIHPSDIPSGKLSDIPSDNNIPSSNQILNTDVSIQIHMDNPKPTNEFTYVDSNPNQVDDTYVDSNPDNSSMDTILEDLEKYNEPYYDVQDDIYYDVNDHDASTVDSNNMDVSSKVQIEMDVNTKLVKEKYPIADVWDI